MPDHLFCLCFEGWFFENRDNGSPNGFALSPPGTTEIRSVGFARENRKPHTVCHHFYKRY